MAYLFCLSAPLVTVADTSHDPAWYKDFFHAAVTDTGISSCTTNKIAMYTMGLNLPGGGPGCSSTGSRKAVSVPCQHFFLELE